MGVGLLDVVPVSVPVREGEAVRVLLAVGLPVRVRVLVQEGVSVGVGVAVTWTTSVGLRLFSAATNRTGSPSLR